MIVSSKAGFRNLNKRMLTKSKFKCLKSCLGKRGSFDVFPILTVLESDQDESLQHILFNKEFDQFSRPQETSSELFSRTIFSFGKSFVSFARSTGDFS